MSVPQSLVAALLATALWLYWGPFKGSVSARAAVLAASGGATLLVLAWAAWPNRLLACIVPTLLASAGASFLLARRNLDRRSGRLFVISIAQSLVCYGAIAVMLTLGRPQEGTPLLVPWSLGMLLLRQVHLAYESHRRTLQPMELHTWLAYLFFVPTLVAGPLERLSAFRRQLAVAFAWNHVSTAAERILTGAFKKMVVADVLLAALLPPADVSGSAFRDIAWPAVVFACMVRLLQVYFDFAGYSDMARGIARLFGVELVLNFDRPFLRTTLAEFWRHWHISLSSFMRDHVYLPLLGQTRRPAVALTATMIVIGLWHGLAVGWLLWALHQAAGLVVLARWQRALARSPRLLPWRTHGAWKGAALLSTWFYLAAGSAFLWRPDDPLVGLETYLRLWSLGWL